MVLLLDLPCGLFLLLPLPNGTLGSNEGDRVTCLGRPCCSVPLCLTPNQVQSYDRGRAEGSYLRIEASEGHCDLTTG
jgi:hypothetical protein